MRSVAAISLALSAFSLRSVSAASMTSVGCFNSGNGLDNQGTWKYQSSGYCQETCVATGATVMAMSNGNECWCGSSLPPKSSLQSDASSCNMQCAGYPDDVCGGNGYWTVFYTGSDTNVPYFGGGSPSSSAAKASVTPSSVAAGASQKPASSTSEPGQATVITSISPGKTVFITQTPVAQSSSPSDSKKGGGTNTAGVAVGVVVSIVVLSALTGAALFFYRRKQRRDAEMGHQQLDDFASPTSTKPMTFRPAPGPDARIDHDAMAQRRMSDGSIADNEDYSRRILKVTNA